MSLHDFVCDFIITEIMWLGVKHLIGRLWMREAAGSSSHLIFFMGYLADDPKKINPQRNIASGGKEANF